MAKPKLFIGSSKANIRVARLVATRLERDGTADVTIWEDGVFSLNSGFLEKLLQILNDFDFAILIWAPDDVTESKGESKASPRDNVIFECGLFMGAVGRDRVFIICDQSVSLKIPSDLAGVTLADYDGSRIGGDDAEAAVRAACELITREIQRPRFPAIVGQWKSRYALAAEPGHDAVIEDVEVKASRGGVSIVSKQEAGGDPYTAHGRIFHERQVMGEWQARLGNGNTRGLFMLTVNPRGTVMYGYCTGVNEIGASVYTTWVLARNNGADDKTIKQWLRWGEEFLKNTTITLPLPEVEAQI